MLDKIMVLFRNLSSFVIIAASLTNLLAGSRYERYVSYIVGLIVGAFVLSGVMGLFDGYKEYYISLPGNDAYSDCIARADEIYVRAYEDTVCNELTKSIKASLDNKGYRVRELNCYYIKNEGYYVSFMADSKENINVIKNYIVDVYQMDSLHILGYTKDDKLSGQ